MKLNNKNELSQLKWEIESLIAIVLELTGKKPSTEIRENQNTENAPIMICSIRRHLTTIEDSLNG